jgi:hypothetical protein
MRSIPSWGKRKKGKDALGVSKNTAMALAFSMAKDEGSSSVEHIQSCGFDRSRFFEAKRATQ